MFLDECRGDLSRLAERLPTDSRHGPLFPKELVDVIRERIATLACKAYSEEDNTDTAPTLDSVFAVILLRLQHARVYRLGYYTCAVRCGAWSAMVPPPPRLKVRCTFYDL